MARDEAPYWLSAAGRNLCAVGPAALMRDLLMSAGATRMAEPTFPRGYYVAMPATRNNVLTLEACGSPAWASEEYIALRAELLAPGLGHIEWLNAKVAPKRPMLPHQTEFCAHAIGMRGAFNASERGLGKTACGWVMRKAWEAQKTLIVCPKPVMGEWDNEQNLTLDYPDLVPVIQLDSTFTVATRRGMLYEFGAMPDPMAVIINYEVLDDLQGAITSGYKPDLVELDECWKVKNPKAKTTKAAIAICDSARHVLLHTGSPLGNDVGDLWSQKRMLMGYDMGDFMDYNEWMQRFCRYIRVEVAPQQFCELPIGCLNPAGLMQAMAPHYYRATKATCLRLPPKVHHQMDLELPPASRIFYDRIEADGMAALGDGLSLQGERVLKLRLQQYVGGHLFNPDDHTMTEIGSPKLDSLMEFATNELLHTRTVRCLVWCRFNLEVARIHRMLSELLGLHRVAGITGSGPFKKENAEIDAIKASFNSRSEEGVQVMVMQTQKMCSGHNLQAGDHHLWFSKPWSAIQYDQACDRSDRMGRIGGVQYWHMTVRGTVDEVVDACVYRKIDLMEGLSPATVSQVMED